MPLYDYRCRDCDSTFEARRSIADADRDVTCPAGHTAVTRRLPVFAAGGRSSSGSAAMGDFAGPAAGGGGGCCGGSCGCGAR
jgi:putative FmdB family regulatory protein